MRFFNTARPCNPQDHYMLPPTERLPGLRRLIDQKGYFGIHAPRQTGKTTAMLELGRELTATGSGRIDLCLRYGPDTVAMELKVWRDSYPDPLNEGLAQLDGYLTGLGLETGWLVIFDRRSGLPRIGERTTTEAATTPSGRAVTVIRG